MEYTIKPPLQILEQFPSAGNWVSQYFVLSREPLRKEVLENKIFKGKYKPLVPHSSSKWHFC